jgi:glucosamine-6-phosphate deaminase
VTTFDTVEALAGALADDLHALIAGAAGPVLIGVPAGRTLAPVVGPLADRLRGERLDHVVLVMMDDYLVDDGLAPVDAHFSCRRFGLDLAAAIGIEPHAVWSPDPTDPPAYDARIADAGGIDLFLVAVGASDGHVAFNAPGTPLGSRTRTVELAESTRRDNLGTFPAFGSLGAVPTHGVSVGLATILDARRVALVAHGPGKADAVRRLLTATNHDPQWPATLVHRHPDVRWYLDAAALAATEGISA